MTCDSRRGRSASSRGAGPLPRGGQPLRTGTSPTPSSRAATPGQEAAALDIADHGPPAHRTAHAPTNFPADLRERVPPRSIKKPRGEPSQHAPGPLSTYPRPGKPRPSPSDNVSRRMHESNVRGLSHPTLAAFDQTQCKPVPYHSANPPGGRPTRVRFACSKRPPRAAPRAGGLHGGVTTPEPAAGCPEGSWTYCRAWTSPRSSPRIWRRFDPASWTQPSCLYAESDATELTGRQELSGAATCAGAPC